MLTNGDTATEMDFEKIPVNVYLNLAYKHNVNDFNNPSWPAGQKDTFKIKQGQAALKTFKTSMNYRTNHWAQPSDMFPAPKNDAHDPVEWAKIQTGFGNNNIHPREVNNAVLITMDGFPRIGDINGAVSTQDQAVSINFKITVYHHFACRQPRQNQS